MHHHEQTVTTSSPRRNTALFDRETQQVMCLLRPQPARQRAHLAEFVRRPGTLGVPSWGNHALWLPIKTWIDISRHSMKFSLRHFWLSIYLFYRKSNIYSLCTYWRWWLFHSYHGETITGTPQNLWLFTEMNFINDRFQGVLGKSLTNHGTPTPLVFNILTRSYRWAMLRTNSLLFWRINW